MTSYEGQKKFSTIKYVNSLNVHLYWPDNAGDVAVQLDRMIINAYGGNLWLFTGLLSRIMRAT